jgi:hypothetical protein
MRGRTTTEALVYVWFHCAVFYGSECVFVTQNYRVCHCVAVIMSNIE